MSIFAFIGIGGGAISGGLRMFPPECDFPQNNLSCLGSGSVGGGSSLGIGAGTLAIQCYPL